MTLSDNLPTDSVLRRHAQAERNRILGLPPTDSVLRRHHGQLQSVLQGASPAGSLVRAAAMAAPRPAAASTPPRVEAPRTAAIAPAAPKTDGGGLFGWLRRLLGA